MKEHTALGKEGGLSELMDELNYMRRKIESLEDQSDLRHKLNEEGNLPFKRQIDALKQQLEDERVQRLNIINKKNAEIAYFKQELESLLSEIAKQHSKKATGKKQTAKPTDNVVVDL